MKKLPLGVILAAAVVTTTLVPAISSAGVFVNPKGMCYNLPQCHNKDMTKNDKSCTKEGAIKMHKKDCEKMKGQFKR